MAGSHGPVIVAHPGLSPGLLWGYRGRCAYRSRLALPFPAP